MKRLASLGHFGYRLKYDGAEGWWVEKRHSRVDEVVAEEEVVENARRQERIVKC